MSPTLETVSQIQAEGKPISLAEVQPGDTINLFSGSIVNESLSHVTLQCLTNGVFEIVSGGLRTDIGVIQVQTLNGDSDNTSVALVSREYLTGSKPLHPVVAITEAPYTGELVITGGFLSENSGYQARIIR